MCGRARRAGTQSQPPQQAHAAPTTQCPPLAAVWWSGARCPPKANEFGYTYTIGRTMFETDGLPSVFVPRCAGALLAQGGSS